MRNRREVIAGAVGGGALGFATSLRASDTPPIALNQFGSGLNAWLAAAEAINTGRATTIIVPPGEHRIDRAALQDKREGLIVLRAAARLVFQPGSLILFDYIGLPLFTFTQGAGGGLIGSPRFVFTGQTPSSEDMSREQFSEATGFAETSFIGGGGFELWALVLANSSGLVLENVRLESATPGSELHLTPFVFNLKPPSLSKRAVGNTIRNTRLRDVQHGLLYVGQDGLVVQDFDVDRRGGLKDIAPGHAIYASGLPVQRNLRCKIERVCDGPNAINWPASGNYNLATIAPKESQFCSFTRVTSSHPAGLIQSLQDCSDCEFANWSWTTADTARALAPALNVVGSNQRCTFRNFTIRAPGKTFMVANTGVAPLSQSTFANFDVVSDFNLHGAQQGVFDLYGSGNTFSQIVLEPSRPITAVPQLAYVIRHPDSSGNHFAATLRGRYATPAMLRVPGVEHGSQAVVRAAH